MSFGPASASLPQVGGLFAGKYRIENVLGQGGMGMVVSAVHEQLEQRVAIKVLLDTALAYPEVIERFKREARAMARLRNEHVVRVLDVGTLDSGAPFMVMEHLEGIDLSELLAQQGPMSLHEAVACMLQACEALAIAHAARVVHRDVKPANLFLASRPGGEAIIKVLDFGIAKALDDKNMQLTRTTAMMGTAYYMSPEQLTASKEVDARTDIWSLGVVLFELLTGQVPFDSDNLTEIVAMILRAQAPKVTALRPDLPLELDHIIQNCMQSDLSMRYQTVGDLARALSVFAAAQDSAQLERIERSAPASMLPSAPFPSLPPQQGPKAQLGALPAQRHAAPAPAPAPAPTAEDDDQARTRFAMTPDRRKQERQRFGYFLGGFVALLGVVAAVLVTLRALQPEPAVSEPVPVAIETPPPTARASRPVLAPAPVEPALTAEAQEAATTPSATVAAAPQEPQTRRAPTRAPSAPAPKPTAAPRPGGFSLDMDMK